MQYYSVCVFVLFGLVQEGCGIECYSCISKGRLDNEACVKFDKSKIPLKKCDLTELDNTKKYAQQIDESISNLFHLDIQTQDPQLPMNCLKQITKVGGQEIVLRGCQLAATEQLDICYKVKDKNQENLHTDYCSLCNSDGCNSAPVAHSMPFLLVALMVSSRFF